MTDEEKLRDYDRVCAVAGAAFGLFSECQRIDALIRHHNLQPLIAPIDGSRMFNFINAVDKRGKAHRASTMTSQKGNAP